MWKTGDIETVWWSLLAVYELTCYCHLHETDEGDSMTLPTRVVPSIKGAKICRIAFGLKTLSCIFSPVNKAKPSRK